MRNLHLHCIGIITRGRCCLRFWQLFQRFLYQNECFGNFNPLRIGKILGQHLIDLLQQQLRGL